MTRSRRKEWCHRTLANSRFRCARPGVARVGAPSRRAGARPDRRGVAARVRDALARPGVHRASGINRRRMALQLAKPRAFSGGRPGASMGESPPRSSRLALCRPCRVDHLSSRYGLARMVNPRPLRCLISAKITLFSGKSPDVAVTTRGATQEDESPMRRKVITSRIRTRDQRVAAFESKVDRSKPCWVWTGWCDPNGYGQFFDGARVVGAHRFAYELWVGPIPAELVLDHLCRNPSCVNPAHLEAVTRSENALRGYWGALKTECVNGHAFTESTTGHTARGHRYCRVCKRAYMRRYHAKRRAA